MHSGVKKCENTGENTFILHPSSRSQSADIGQEAGYTFGKMQR